jgi:CheY-like chemotaxis protein
MSLVVLSVEDDRAAFRLLEIAFSELGIEVSLHRVESGAQALDFLHHAGPYAEAPQPHLILLNLNLPRMTGLELLSAIQQDATIADIPAVVFTSSRLDTDRARCLALGARDFLTKPADYLSMLDAVRRACGHVAGGAGNLFPKAGSKAAGQAGA